MYAFAIWFGSAMAPPPVAPTRCTLAELPATVSATYPATLQPAVCIATTNAMMRKLTMACAYSAFTPMESGCMQKNRATNDSSTGTNMESRATGTASQSQPMLGVQTKAMLN